MPEVDKPSNDEDIHADAPPAKKPNIIGKLGKIHSSKCGTKAMEDNSSDSSFKQIMKLELT